jgi:carbamoylphosphate synthase small subunit
VSLREGLLVLASGEVFEGELIGAEPAGPGATVASGEVVFNTALSGYQEIVTDPSYAGQVITFTYPHIGNYGVNATDFEARRPFCRGVVVRDLARRHSNWRADDSLDGLLRTWGVPGIAGIDTRRLTRVLRDHGAMAGALGAGSEADLLAAAQAEPGTDGVDLVAQVTTPQPYFVDARGNPIVPPPTAPATPSTARGGPLGALDAATSPMAGGRPPDAPDAATSPMAGGRPPDAPDAGTSPMAGGRPPDAPDAATPSTAGGGPLDALGGPTPSTAGGSLAGLGGVARGTFSAGRLGSQGGCQGTEGAGSDTAATLPYVVAFDFGIKRTILRHLATRFHVEVVPASTSAADVLARDPAGVFLSNGPGDPAAVPYAVEAIAGLLGNVPIFGICLGHQLLARALGVETVKLPFGHHGANHPVRNLATGHIEITSQNHNFAVPAGGLAAHGAAMTHVNLNDGVCEGLRVLDAPAFSVQHHPEAGPGPHDSRYLFDEFAALLGADAKAGAS